MRRYFMVALLIFPAGLRAQTPEWTVKRPLPVATGRHAVGTQTFVIADTVTFPDGSRVARPVACQVWYPASPGAMATKARYVNDPALLDAMIRERYLDLTADDLRGWHDLRLSAIDGAPPSVAAGGHGWPAIVLSHGFGVSRVNYAALAQEMASRGYVVLGVDHPYGGFALSPDGNVLQPGGDSLRRRLGSTQVPASVDSAMAWDARRWAFEAAAVVTRVAARKTGRQILDAVAVDTLHVGMLGHSLGGAAALQACRDYSIFRACADMDGEPVGDVEREGVAKPILVLLSQPAGAKTVPRDSAERAGRDARARMGRERDSTLQAIVARHPWAPAFVIKIRGIAHFSFSDAPFLMPALLEGTGSTLSASRAESLIVAELTDFFDHFLRGVSLRHLRVGTATAPQ